MPEVRKDPISKLAAKLITGGDNLEFINVGIKGARQDYNSISVIQLTQSATTLTEILNKYEWTPCGYGKSRLSKVKQTSAILKHLEITKPN